MDCRAVLGLNNWFTTFGCGPKAALGSSASRYATAGVVFLERRQVTDTPHFFTPSNLLPLFDRSSGTDFQSYNIVSGFLRFFSGNGTGALRRCDSKTAA